MKFPGVGSSGSMVVVMMGKVEVVGVGLVGVGVLVGVGELDSSGTIKTTSNVVMTPAASRNAIK